MTTERTEKFVNAIACDLEEAGFQQVSGTMLRRTLSTAVSAALPLLQPAELAEQQGDARAQFEAWTKKSEELYDLARYEEDPDRYLSGPTRKAWNAWQAALAATGKQQVGEVQGDALSWIERIEQSIRIGNYTTASREIGEMKAALAARQPGVPNGKLVGWWNGITPGYDGQGDWSIRWGADAENSRHDIPLYDGFNPIHYQQPAHGIDLGQLRELAESWKVVSDPDPTPIMQAHQHANRCCADELLALIDQRDAAPGVGYG